MNTTTLKHNCPLEQQIPGCGRLIFGAMGLGGGWNNDPITAQDRKEDEAAIETALACGIRLFDHADIYTYGKAEQVFGEMLRARPSLRDSMFIQSKCGIRFADTQGPKRYDLSAKHIEASVDAILSRLACGHLDILLLHRPDPLLEPDEIASAWQRIHRSGKVRFLGVSNMHGGQVRYLQQALDNKLVVNQLEMSLAQRDWLESGTCFNDIQGHSALAWADTLESARSTDMQLQSWGALAQGRFCQETPNAPTHEQLTAKLVSRLATEYGVAAEAIVIAFLLRHPVRMQAIIGSRTPARIIAAAGAVKIKMSREHWYHLYETARGNELP